MSDLLHEPEEVTRRKSFIDCAMSQSAVERVRTLRTKSPLFAQYEITSKCNQHCFFCYNVWKEPGQEEIDLASKDKIRVIDVLADLEIFGLIVSGGEPLLVKNLDEIVRRASANSIEVSLISNGALLTSRNLTSLVHSGLESIQISLHSSDQNSHERITGKNGSWDSTTEGIRLAIDVLGEENVSVNMVATSTTHKHVYDTAELLKGYGLRNYSVSSYTFSGLGSSAASQAPGPERFRELFHELQRVKKELDMSVAVGGAFPLCVIGDNVDAGILGMLGNTCDAGITQIVVSPAGFVRPCVSYSERICHIFDEDLVSNWQSHPFLEQLRRMDNLPSVCSRCRHLIYCRGGCRASARDFYGQLDAPHPLMES